MRILIAGVAGFIGVNLAKYHLEKGREVIGLDDLSSGSSENLDLLHEHKNFDSVLIDISNDPCKFEVDQIYNLACVASPIKYQEQSLSTLDACYNGTKNLLELANTLQVPMLHASTSEVYGDPLEHPQAESYRGNVNTWGPRACYDEGKRVAETLCYEFIKKYKLKVAVPRIFNTYGPYMSANDGRMIPNFINQCLNNDPITIYGNGSQTRSIQYISDLIEGFELLLKSNQVNYPINLGSDRELPVIELAQQIKSLIPNCQSDIIYTKLPSDDPQVRRADKKLAQSLLGWRNKISTKDGLLKTINYFNQLNNEK